MSEETRTRSKEFEIGRQKTVVSRILGRWPKKKGSDGPMGLTGDGEDELREIDRERERERESRSCKTTSASRGGHRQSVTSR